MWPWLFLCSASLLPSVQGQCMERKEEEKAQLTCGGPPRSSCVFTPAQHAAPKLWSLQLWQGLRLNLKVLPLGLLCWPLPLER